MVELHESSIIRGFSCTVVQLREGSVTRGLSRTRAQLNGVQLHEGSVTRGSSYTGVQLHGALVTVVQLLPSNCSLSCSLAQLHGGSVAMEPQKRKFGVDSCGLIVYRKKG